MYENMPETCIRDNVGVFFEQIEWNGCETISLWSIHCSLQDKKKTFQPTYYYFYDTLSVIFNPQVQRGIK